MASAAMMRARSIFIVGGSASLRLMAFVRCRYFGFGSPTDHNCWNRPEAESTNQKEDLDKNLL